MQINIKSTKINLTPEIKDYIQKKMDTLEKYLGTWKVIEAHFEVELTTMHHLKGEIFRAELNMLLPHKLLRVEKTEKELFKAIDKVRDHMEVIIKRFKEKEIDRRKKSE
jgi:putative sigma-54 modulation protein